MEFEKEKENYTNKGYGCISKYKTGYTNILNCTVDLNINFTHINSNLTLNLKEKRKEKKRKK